VSRRATRARYLLDSDRRAQAIRARAAEFFGERDAHQAKLAHLAKDRGGKLAGLIHMAGLWRDLLLGELAHRLANHLLFLGQVEIHTGLRVTSLSALSSASIP